mgnify:CR=1 FL=1
MIQKYKQNMDEFMIQVPTQIFFGKTALNDLAESIKQFGDRVILVYGGGSIKKIGLYDQVIKILDESGIFHCEIGGVQPNPRVSLIEEAIQIARENKVDVVLPVGGGSVIDTAKAIAHGKANPDIDIWDFWLGKKKVEKSTPVGVILTIPASGSETSDSAVLTDETILQKRGLNTDYNRPAFAIMDPTLAATLPRRQVACGVTDILMHTLERYFNPIQGNETTMQLAESVLRVAIANGPAVVDNPGNYDAMSEIMWCGSLSHNGLTGLGGAKGLSVHPVSFALSEKFDIIHAEALSALWCSWARYVCKVHPENEKLFARFARSVWDIAEPDIHKAANAGIDASEAYFKSLGMPVSIGALSCGVQDAAGVEDLAARVSYHGTRRVGTLVSLDHEALREIFEMANH